MIEKYEKYPEYVSITVKKPSDMDEVLKTMPESIQNAFAKVLSDKSKDLINLHAFPLKVIVQLIPELNILTVMTLGEGDFIQTDRIMKDLVSFDD